MSFLRIFLFHFAVLVVSPAFASLKVVVSIKPIHSLVAGVMADVGVPVLLLGDNNSPHDASLKPSQARVLQQADLIFWIGPELETFLARPITALPVQSASHQILSFNSLIFPTADSAEHKDPHIWLDPQNAIVIINGITKALVEADPSNAAKYLANASKLVERLFDLERTMKLSLKSFQKAPYISFHDAYGHFENRFGFTNGTSLTVSPENRFGAALIVRTQKEIRRQNIHCVFSEPQFDANILTIITEGTNARISILDPLGSTIPRGPEHYFTLLSNLEKQFRECLTVK